MKKLLILTLLTLSIVSLRAQNPEDIANVNSVMFERARQFRDALGTSTGHRSGVYVYHKRTIKEFENNPAQLAARLALLGFTDVYLGAGHMYNGENATEEKWIFEFNTNAHKFGMKVHIVITNR
jgi:hypothetical protein